MDIFHASKKFPKAEIYALTDQIRRCSRSVCANLGEGYYKRRYKAHFISKLTDSQMENGETQVWLDFARSCEYLTEKQYIAFCERCAEVGRMLQHMVNNPEKYR